MRSVPPYRRDDADGQQALRRDVAVDAYFLGCCVSLTQGGVAFLETIRDLGVGHMFPPLGVCEMFPAMLRVEHGALTADRSHGPVALDALHCGLPALYHAHSLR
jgi:hypothetical protein